MLAGIYLFIYDIYFLLLCTVQRTCQVKDKEIQDKVDKVKLLQWEKSELERARHTDIVKLRLEVFYMHSELTTPCVCN